MTFVASPTEITTSATDALLAIECAICLAWLRRSARGDRWRVGVWCWVFGLLGFAAIIGSVAHGVHMPAWLRAGLWKPLNLSLGFLVGLFLVGAVFDLRGSGAARRLVPYSLALGGVFFAATEILTGGFIVFVLYEGAVMLGALAIYSVLAGTHRLKGAGFVVIAILFNLTAAAIQSSSVSLTLIVPFDHNGLFHLVQMIGVAALGLGVFLGMQPALKQMPSRAPFA